MKYELANTDVEMFTKYFWLYLAEKQSNLCIRQLCLLQFIRNHTEDFYPQETKQAELHHQHTEKPGGGQDDWPSHF